MLTGISGSKTVFRASTMPDSMSAASGERVAAVSVDGVSGVVSVMVISCRSFRRDGTVLLLESRLQGVPRQSGALDPDGELAHAGEDGELAQLSRVPRAAGDQVAEAGE